MRRGEAQAESEVQSQVTGLARAVAIITILQADRCIGLGASSVSELSASPPALAVCVNGAVVPQYLLVPGAAFGVNVLGCGQEHIARSCLPSSAAGLLSQERWSLMGRTPFLSGAQARFACIARDHVVFGGSVILIAEVVRVATHEHGGPLILCDQRYGRFEVNFRQII